MENPGIFNFLSIQYKQRLTENNIVLMSKNPVQDVDYQRNEENVI